MQPLPPGGPQCEDVPDQNVIIGPWTLEQREIAATRLLQYLARELRPGGQIDNLVKKKSPA